MICSPSFCYVSAHVVGHFATPTLPALASPTSPWNRTAIPSAAPVLLRLLTLLHPHIWSGLVSLWPSHAPSIPLSTAAYGGREKQVDTHESFDCPSPSPSDSCLESAVGPSRRHPSSPHCSIIQEPSRQSATTWQGDRVTHACVYTTHPLLTLPLPLRHQGALLCALH